MNPNQLVIHNEGPYIASTNYWETAVQEWNKFILSCNGGAIRLLLPDQLPDGPVSYALEEMGTAYAVILRRGKWQQDNRFRLVQDLSDGTDALEILFEDDSDAPYSMHANLTCAINLPSAEDQNRNDIRFLVYTRVSKFPLPNLELPVYYRIVESLPNLQSLPLIAKPKGYGLGKTKSP